MGEGLPLPWPFPWSVPPVSGARSLALNGAANVDARAKPLDTREACKSLADEAMGAFGSAFPNTFAFELYLIRALSDIDPGPGQDVAVIYPPEFLFVLDAGLESLCGVSVIWRTRYHGDASFPDFGAAALRSVKSRSARDLIYPRVAGQIIIGIKSCPPEDEMRTRLEAAGLQNVEFFGFFATARCQPFWEDTTCADLEAKIDFIKYAEPDGINRLIDFSPGWEVLRLT